jgi:hypothetical protein
VVLASKLLFYFHSVWDLEQKSTMDVKLETMSLTPHPLSVQTRNQANRYDDPFASWYLFNSNMATKPKPTLLALPLESRQVIWEYKMPEDIDITLDKVDWRKN